MIKKTVALFLFIPLLSQGMQDNGLAIAKAHLKNKKDALKRVYDEISNPYEEANAQNYLDAKLAKAQLRAETDHYEKLILLSGLGLLSMAVFLPVVWPKNDSFTRTFFGIWSGIGFAITGLGIKERLKYKSPLLKIL